MAELALKIEKGSGYENGDILCAFNRRRIRCVHAEHLTAPKLFGFTAEGLRSAKCLAAKAMELTRQYRFDRLSKFVIRRTNLRDGTTEEFSDRSNAKGEYVDVPSFLARRLKHPKHSIFGLKGKEFWFGGRTFSGHADLDKVWQEIESSTPERESSYTLWPVGTRDLIDHLFIAVDEFDDAVAEELVESEYDLTDPENPLLVKKRKRQVDWETLTGVDVLRIAQIKDKGQSIDIRIERTHARAQIVKVKEATVAPIERGN